jgi:hypothetical protein
MPGQSSIGLRVTHTNVPLAVSRIGRRLIREAASGKHERIIGRSNGANCGEAPAFYFPTIAR